MSSEDPNDNGIFLIILIFKENNNNPYYDPPSFYGKSKGKNEFELQNSQNEETRIEDEKKQNSALLNPAGEARKSALRSAIIKVTLFVYLIIILIILYEFLK